MPKIDPSNYEGGREQAYVKHYLLEKYLSRWGYKIGSKWDPLVFIDGFAGPWESKHAEFADASFGIGIRALEEAITGLLALRQRSIKGVCVFVEKEPKPFAKLDAFAKANSTDCVLAKAFKGRFVDNIEAIDSYVTAVGVNPFKFVFLDQKGWAATPMKQLKPFVKNRSTELLFNLMTSFLTRFVSRDDLAGRYNDLFGRAGVIEKIRSLPKGTGEREELAVEEYCLSLRTICGFRYVSQAIVMDPTKEKVRYYLAFATNSLHGIKVFKEAEHAASQIQNEVRHTVREKKEGPFLPFDEPMRQSAKVHSLHDGYRRRLRRVVVKSLLIDAGASVHYGDLYGRAMSLPLVTQSDLDDVLKSLEPNIRLELEGLRRKKPDPFREDRVAVINPNRLR
jgi:three-Cys-motif partner protein